MDAGAFAGHRRLRRLACHLGAAQPACSKADHGKPRRANGRAVAAAAFTMPPTAADFRDGGTPPRPRELRSLGALRSLVALMLAPGHARAVYEAVLHHAALSPMLDLWRRTEAPEALRVAAADAVGVLVHTNAHQSTAGLRCLMAAGLGGLIRAGLADEHAPMALVDAAGRLAAALFVAVGSCPSSFPWRRGASLISGGLYEGVAPWPARRVEQDLARTLDEQHAPGRRREYC